MFRTETNPDGLLTSLGVFLYKLGSLWNITLFISNQREWLCLFTNRFYFYSETQPHLPLHVLKTARAYIYCMVIQQEAKQEY